MLQPSSSSPPFEGLVCFSVYAAGLAFNRLYKRLLDRFDITYPQYLVLIALKKSDGQTVGELGQALYLESSTLTPMLKRMENAGLLQRQRDSTDERVVRITLSQAGAQLADQISCVPPDVLAATGMSREQLDALSKELDLLAEQLRA